MIRPRLRMLVLLPLLLHPFASAFARSEACEAAYEAATKMSTLMSLQKTATEIGGDVSKILESLKSNASLPARESQLTEFFRSADEKFSRPIATLLTALGACLEIKEQSRSEERYVRAFRSLERLEVFAMEAMRPLRKRQQELEISRYGVLKECHDLNNDAVKIAELQTQVDTLAASAANYVGKVSGPSADAAHEKVAAVGDLIEGKTLFDTIIESTQTVKKCAEEYAKGRPSIDGRGESAGFKVLVGAVMKLRDRVAKEFPKGASVDPERLADERLRMKPDSSLGGSGERLRTSSPSRSSRNFR